MKKLQTSVRLSHIRLPCTWELLTPLRDMRLAGDDGDAKTAAEESALPGDRSVAPF